MEKEVFNKISNFFDIYNNMDKWVVIAKYSDGDVVISKDGKIAFDIDIVGEIAQEHQNMGAEIEIMRYEKYREIYKYNN